MGPITAMFPYNGSQRMSDLVLLIDSTCNEHGRCISIHRHCVAHLRAVKLEKNINAFLGLKHRNLPLKTTIALLASAIVNVQDDCRIVGCCVERSRLWRNSPA